MTWRFESVAITGVGTICSLGSGADALLSALVDRRSGLQLLEDHADRLTDARVGRISSFDVDAFVDPNRSRRMDRLSQLAVAAAWLAVRDAGLRRVGRDSPHHRLGVTFGSAYGCQSTELRYAEKLVTHGAHFTNPIDFPDSIDGAPAAHVAMELGIEGPSSTHADGHLSGELAFQHGVFDLVTGRADCVLAGGGDVWTPLLHQTLEALGETAGGHAPPGEGVGYVVLERAADAVARGARVYANVAALAHEGPDSRPDAWPEDATSSSAASSQALREARVQPAQVGVLSLASAGEIEVDRVEQLMQSAVFGDWRPEPLKLYSLTGAIAGGGILRIAAASLGMHRRLWSTDVRVVMHHAMTRGGQSLALLLQRP